MSLTKIHIMVILLDGENNNPGANHEKTLSKLQTHPYPKERSYAQWQTESLLPRMRTPIRLQSGANSDFLNLERADTEAIAGENTITGDLQSGRRESPLAAGFHGRFL